LLTGGSRTALPHQQTLRATLDWSYDLLTGGEGAALRRLAVFPGGFNVDAAAALVSDPTIDELEVIELLSQLVARSLVVADTSAAGARYRLLETTRAYAMEKLDAVGESELCRRRHAEHFRDYFDPAPEDWLHKPDVDWRNRYVPELDNLRVALDWAFSAAGDAAIGIALASASGAVWSETSLRNEGRQRIDVALSCVEAGTPERELARLWFWLGWIVNAVPLEAAAAYAHAVEHYRKTDDSLGLGFSLHRLGGELTYMGRVEQAAPMLAEASSLLESAGPKVLAEHSLLLGTSKMLTGDFANARAHYEAAVSLCRDAGADRVAVAVLGNLADLHWMSGNLEAALVAFREAISLARNSLPARRLALALALTNFAGVLTECGRFDEALTAAREGLPVRLEFMFAWCTLDHLALRAGLTGKLASAGRISGYADRAYAANGSERQPNEARARDRLLALLREQLTSEEIAKLTAEGAEMTEDEACRLALEG
jgi:tetratricopeptide (TPR) repeat protein